MRNALPLLIAGTCLAVLPLLGPAASRATGVIEGRKICVAPAAMPITTARDWLGSLHGWQDSVLGLAWRGTLATAKGKPGPTICAR